jgi:hypothetical protein
MEKNNWGASPVEEHRINSRQMAAFAGLFAVMFLLLTFAVHYVLRDNPIGIDYYFYWNAGKSLFIEDLNPYSIEHGQRNQYAVYGRLAEDGEDHLNFPYPIYTLFILSPLLVLEYEWSQAAWMSLNLLLLISIGPILFPQARKWIVLELLLFYTVYFTIIIGNVVLLIAILFIFVIEKLFFRQRTSRWIDFFMGLLLSIAIVKPQFSWLFLIFIFYQCLVERRQKVILGFIAGSLMLLAGAFAFLPTWLIDWIYNLTIYSKYIVLHPMLVTYLSVIIPVQGAYILFAILLPIFLSVTVYLVINWRKGAFEILPLLAWIGFVTNIFDPSSLTPNKLALIIPMLLWAVKTPSIKAVKITWTLGILLTNFAFVMVLLNFAPDAVEHWPLLFYVPWLVYMMIGQEKQVRNIVPAVG